MGVLILGHRGFRGELENTLPAFRRAIRYAQGIEFDVRTTGDGKVVVHHDEHFTVGKERYYLKDLTLPELRRLHPLGKLIPTVDALLRELPPVHLDVDVKEAEAGEEALDLIEKYGAVERTVFSTDDPGTARALLHECPYCRVGFSIVGYSSVAWIPRLRGLYSIHVPIDGVSYVGYGPFTALLRTLRKRGFKLYLWNYKMDELLWVPRLEPLADVVISDDPAMLRKVFLPQGPR
ncbi:glycerophosphodiester phosphodiesterase [Thermococcus profundus]|uniref:Glycerophosphodiester phosphodiesterase n=1 Tax=Thermococcus profundus TaxID=49899 RepID=A0A2Z2M831_THEPR|nr:glycerophosphodiester phosphodiesterase family protein [Thermococcus profundus]ASJ02427.1 glycerophosphodiester phosphodiesterase [Thermococcus profundus]